MKSKKKVFVGYSDTESPDDLLFWDCQIDTCDILTMNYPLMRIKHGAYKNKIRITIEQIGRNNMRDELIKLYRQEQFKPIPKDKPEYDNFSFVCEFIDALLAKYEVIPKDRITSKFNSACSCKNEVCFEEKTDFVCNEKWKEEHICTKGRLLFVSAGKIRG